MQKGQYSKEDKEFMCITDKSRNSSRIKELINFLKLNNYKIIGIASCFSVYSYAEKLKDILEAEGFDVKMIHCKETKLEAVEISEELKGLSCDPISQAEFLNQHQTEFNINFGLCLGHGILFAKYSKAPLTTLLVKDPCNQHNIMENFI
ncbi:MAG: DUF1847 domain-containing protein [Alphaproteobacteria bacterium]|nr:DUF1847 domain-containing protein [Alphaproteobacteria bacterium]